MEYKQLVEVYERLESTSKRLEKTHVLSEFLRSADNLEIVMLLVQGKVFPNWDSRELGMAARLLLKSICVATGAPLERVEGVWKETGDLGTVALELIKTKTQATLFSQSLTIRKVFDNLRKISEMEGSGTVDRKVQLVAELLTSASPVEAKYIIRTILGELRVGLGEGTVRDSIVWAFFADRAGVKFEDGKLILEDRAVYNKYCDLVQEALDVANDFAEIALIAKQGEEGLRDVSLKPGKPIKVMLYQKASGIENAFEKVGKPAAFEYKYDGFMVQIHKSEGRVSLFTRRLENVSAQFPDVVERITKNVSADNFIFDAELVGVDLSSEKYLSFQSISQRIKRKHDIELMAKRFPVEVNVFDVTFFNGKSLLKEPFSERRKILVSVVDEVYLKIKPAVQLVTDKLDEAEEFYSNALAAGNEGVMAKNVDSFYKPGSRVGFGVKVKPTMDTLEVVIVGAEFGEGKRSQWLASFVVAVRNSEDDSFVEIGRVGTGIKEKEEEGVSFDQLTKLLEPLIIEEKGREVKVRPEVVIEVDYEEVQASPTYNSGFALRFPRLVKLREDRAPEDANSVDDIKLLYSSQRGRNV